MSTSAKFSQSRRAPAAELIKRAGDEAAIRIPEAGEEYRGPWHGVSIAWLNVPKKASRSACPVPSSLASHVR
jgi:hypothetical protein